MCEVAQIGEPYAPPQHFVRSGRSVEGRRVGCCRPIMAEITKCRPTRPRRIRLLLQPLLQRGDVVPASSATAGWLGHSGRSPASRSAEVAVGGCTALTESGSPCRMPPLGEGEYCLMHSPDHAEEVAEGFRLAKPPTAWTQCSLAEPERPPLRIQTSDVGITPIVAKRP